MRILVLDDNRARQRWYWELYRRRHETLRSFLVDHAVKFIGDRWANVVHLDYDLDLTFPGPGRYREEYHSGMVAARALVDGKRTPGSPELASDDYDPIIIVHSWNPSGGRAMFDLLEENGFRVVYQPWCWQHDPKVAAAILRKAFPEALERHITQMLTPKFW